MASPAKKFQSKLTGIRPGRKTNLPHSQTAKRLRFEQMVKLIKPKGNDHAPEA
jgi:hypothetical protein